MPNDFDELILTFVMNGPGSGRTNVMRAKNKSRPHGRDLYKSNLQRNYFEEGALLLVEVVLVADFPVALVVLVLFVSLAGAVLAAGLVVLEAPVEEPCAAAPSVIVAAANKSARLLSIFILFVFNCE